MLLKTSSPSRNNGLVAIYRMIFSPLKVTPQISLSEAVSDRTCNLHLEAQELTIHFSV